MTPETRGSRNQGPLGQVPSQQQLRQLGSVAVGMVGDPYSKGCKRPRDGGGGLLGFSCSPPPVVSFPQGVPPGAELLLTRAWDDTSQGCSVLFYAAVLGFESTGRMLVLYSPEISLFTSICSCLYTVPILCVCMLDGETGMRTS